MKDNRYLTDPVAVWHEGELSAKDLADPVVVWRAAVGEPEKLVALLQSGDPLPFRVRMALAAWVSGEFDDAKAPRGRPLEHWSRQFTKRAAVGHYKRTMRNRRFSSERILNAVAKRYRMDSRTLENLIRRGVPKIMIPKPKTEAEAFAIWKAMRKK